MSGICGILHLDGRPAEAETLKKMMDALAHRGSDGSGTWREGPAALGHQMLHLTPESLTEKLPFSDPQARVAITADARLDNRMDLFRHLEIPRSRQAGMTDSELILEAYKKWGKECPRYLLGDFVFVIWDGVRQELICATDPIGLIPLYYYHTPDVFVFASEIKGIHAVPGVPRAINKRTIALMEMPAMHFIEPESTFFERITQMPGSTVVTVSHQGIWKQEYWRPDPSRRIHLKDEMEYVEAFQEIFFQAVSARLRSAFPVFTLYSGGLDSSAVTGTAVRLLRQEGRRLTAFAAVLPDGYQGSGTDERSYIDLLQGTKNLEIAYITDPWRGPFDDVDRLVWGADSPSHTSRHYLYTAFAEAAGRHHGRVLLDGGGGEFGPSFHGYGYYAELFWQGRWKRLVQEIRARARNDHCSPLSIIKSQVIAPLIPDFFMTRLRPRFAPAQIKQSITLREDFVQRQLGQEVSRYQRMCRSFETVSPSLRRNQYQQMLLLIRRGWQSGYFVGYERVSLASPFLDRRVLEFCLALPGDMKVNHGYKRYLIRAGMRGILPETLRFRTSKDVFSSDFHDRYNRQKSIACEALARAEKHPAVQEIVDLDKLKRMLQLTMQTNRCDTPNDFATMHAVPGGIYLISFLQRFS
jgi:asparagine synthase (glutamine-hydrolysing)